MQNQTYIYQLAEFYSEVGNFVTEHGLHHLSNDEMNHKYQEYLDLSYPAHSLLKRLQDFHQHAELPFLYIYNEMTLRNIILTDRENIRRELVNRGCPVVNIYNDEQLIHLYFGQHPTRDQLVEYIREMVTVEYDLTSPGAELPIGSLMIGLFYLPHYYHKEDVNWVPNKGNLHLLSPNDLSAIGYLLGAPLDANQEKIESYILKEQNKFANELLDRGYIERIEIYSITETVIQKDNSCVLPQRPRLRMSA